MGYVRVIDKLDKLVRYLIVAALMVALATVGAAILMRNVFGFSFPWSEELAKYLVIFVAFCTAGIGSRNGVLTRLTFLVDLFHLKEKAAWTVEWIIGLVSIGFYVLVGYSTCRMILMLQSTGQVSAAMKIPQWIPYVGVLFGCALLILNTLAYLIAGGKENEEIERSEAE